MEFESESRGKNLQLRRVWNRGHQRSTQVYSSVRFPVRLLGSGDQLRRDVGADVGR